MNSKLGLTTCFGEYWDTYFVIYVKYVPAHTAKHAGIHAFHAVHDPQAQTNTRMYTKSIISLSSLHKPDMSNGCGFGPLIRIW